MSEKTLISQFKPDYAVSPGEILSEILEVAGITKNKFAECIGIDEKEVDNIFKGKERITKELALKFERVFGLRADFWINLERNYQDILAVNKEVLEKKGDSKMEKVVKINFNDLAKKVTLLEGLKQSQSIGDVKEIIGLVIDELDKFPDDILVREVRRLAKQRRKQLSKKG